MRLLLSNIIDLYVLVVPFFKDLDVLGKIHVGVLYLRFGSIFDESFIYVLSPGNL